MRSREKLRRDFEVDVVGDVERVLPPRVFELCERFWPSADGLRRRPPEEVARTMSGVDAASSELPEDILRLTGCLSGTRRAAFMSGIPELTPKARAS